MRNSDPIVRIVCSWTLFWSQLHICRASSKLQLPMRVHFWCSLWSNLSVQKYLRLLAECTHDKPLHLWLVRILQCLSSWNIVQFPQRSGILHPYKIYSICLVVIAFQLVLHISAIEDLCEHGQHNPKALLSWSRLARMRNSIALRQRVAPFNHEGFVFFTHFCDCSVKTELIYRGNCAKVLIVSKSAQ